MNSASLREHLARLDAALAEPTRLCVYGAAALMLMGEEDRFSVDIDVAGPYSAANERALAEAARQVNLPVNPSEEYSGDHIEWVGLPRLCLAPPNPNEAVILWRGGRLTVFTVPPSDLIASRLIRYDPTDQADIQFLLIHTRPSFAAIRAAVERLPSPFRDDALVRDNLDNLQRDLRRWMP